MRLLSIACLLVLAPPAFAGDDDDEPIDTTPTTTGETGEDLLGGEDTDTSVKGGEDTEAIYRKELDAVKGLEADDELQEWEGYLAKYPNSLFKDRIQKHMTELEDSLYARNPTDNPADHHDAKDDEIDLAIPLQLEPINPRQSLQAGFEWGLPDYINLFGEYQHPLRRDLALAVGVHHRYTGVRFEAGARWAFVKSTRTQTVATVLADIGLNTIPAYPVLRPQLAIGKKFGDIVDLQAQAGAEFDTRGHAGVRPIGGLNANFAASDSVHLFVEASTYQQWLKSPKGTLGYRFDTATLGMNFRPAGQGIERGQLEINLGATMPWATQYWQFHYGSIMGQVNWFFH